MPEPRLDEIYLGDGAYVHSGSFKGEIVLTTSNGYTDTNAVVLGPTELCIFLQWLQDTGVWTPTPERREEE